MNSLKRTLSLVLVLVMVLGLVGVAGAAYKDEAQIQYKEAVGVMTGIGAIEGDAGAFNPAGNLTRAAAAKMVAYTVLGADVAKLLPVKASSFKDVNANFAWAIPSIEYLVLKGVIEGYGDGNFGPNDPVTGNQLAKMLLVAAGYGKKGEFSSNSWELNTAVLATGKGIFKGSKAADFSKPATREEAALYCFNALDLSFVSWSKDLEDYVVKTPVASTHTAIYPTLIKQTAEAAGVDSFGRPATLWTYKDETIVSVGKLTPVAKYNDSSYVKAFVANTYEFASNLSILVNGEAWTANVDNTAPGGTVADLMAANFNGTGIELYNTDTDKEIELIVMTQGYLTKVDSYTATKGVVYGNFKLSIYNPWDAGKVATKTVTDTKSTTDLFDKLLAAGLAKDSYFVTYTKGAALAGNIIDFTVAKTVTGVLSTYSMTGESDGYNGNMTVGGTKYIAASGLAEGEGFVNASMAAYLGKNVTLYLDQYGMVVGAVPEKVAVTTADLFYLTALYTKTTVNAYGGTVTTNWAQGVDMTGKEVNYQITATEATALTSGTKTLYTIKTVYDATLKANVADLTAVTDTASLVNVETVTGDHAAIPATAAKIADGNYYNADTQFIFVTGSESTLKVSTAKGAQAIAANKTYNFYATKAAADTNYVVRYVIVDDAATVATAENLMFVPLDFTTNTAVPYTTAEGLPAVAYKNVAFIDGQPKLDVLVTADGAAAAKGFNGSTVSGFYTYSVDAKTGIYTLTPATSGFGFGKVSNVFGDLVSITGKLATGAAVPADTNAKGAFIVDVPYLAGMLLNGYSPLTQITALGELKGATVTFTYKTVNGAALITGIYAVEHAA